MPWRRTGERKLRARGVILIERTTSIDEAVSLQPNFPLMGVNDDDLGE